MDGRGSTVSVFHKRTRKGKFIRVVQEKYTRSDSGLGSLRGSQLSAAELATAVDNTPRKTLIVIDTNIVIHHVDVLESSFFGELAVVVCQTVMSEVRKLNLSIFKRLSALVSDPGRNFVFFPNELTTETLQPRAESETTNDYNDRLVTLTAQYFKAHIPQDTSFMLVTNDVGHKERALKCNIDAIALRDFVIKVFGRGHELLDSFAVPIPVKAASLFAEHVDVEELMRGVRSAKYIKGILRVKNGDWENCYVVSYSTNGDKQRKYVDVKGALNVNRAMDGDTVVVQILSESSQSNSADEYKDMEGIFNDDCQRVGAVIGILKRETRVFRGSLTENDAPCNFENSDEFGLFSPITRNAPPVWVYSQRLHELHGKRIVVQVDSWPSSSKYPIGHCVQILGDIGDKEVETKIVLNEYGVSSEDFSVDVMGCLPPRGWEISEKDLIGRQDYRGIPVVSIDPPGCKDIDDALHCIRLPNGRLQVGVHIADVTHFVLPDTPLDKEAARRSTSTYLVEKRLDMLPSLLTTELCSLRSSEDHLAFSVLWEMDENAHIYDVSFSKSVIRSVASLTYDQAQTMIDNNDPEHSCVDASVISLNKIAKILKKDRIAHGALTLASPEVRFKLDSETLNPTDVAIYAHKEANSLVEEFMLLANITVSKKILKHYPTLAILRRHQPPSIEQFRPLLAAAQVAGVSLDVTTSKSLADSLDAAVREDDLFFNKLLRMLSTRCMMPAQYFCSGEIPKDQWHHYGLAAHLYTHFTSPIRRYADVLVHRLLAASIGVAPLHPTNSSRRLQQELCTHMNRRHKAAQYAQRSSVQLYTKFFFRNKVSLEDGYIISMSNSTVSVLIPRYGIECGIEIDKICHALEADSHDFKENDQLLVLLAGGKECSSLKILDKVTVEMRGSDSTDIDAGIELRWVKT